MDVWLCLGMHPSSINETKLLRMLGCASRASVKGRAKPQELQLSGRTKMAKSCLEGLRGHGYTMVMAAADNVRTRA